MINCDVCCGIICFWRVYEEVLGRANHALTPVRLEGFLVSQNVPWVSGLWQVTYMTALYGNQGYCDVIKTVFFQILPYIQSVHKRMVRFQK